MRRPGRPANLRAFSTGKVDAVYADSGRAFLFRIALAARIAHPFAAIRVHDAGFFATAPTRSDPSARALRFRDARALLISGAPPMRISIGRVCARSRASPRPPTSLRPDLQYMTDPSRPQTLPPLHPRTVNPSPAITLTRKSGPSDFDTDRTVAQCARPPDNVIAGAPGPPARRGRPRYRQRTSGNAASTFLNSAATLAIERAHRSDSARAGVRNEALAPSLSARFKIRRQRPRIIDRDRLCHQRNAANQVEHAGVSSGLRPLPYRPGRRWACSTRSTASSAPLTTAIESATTPSALELPCGEFHQRGSILPRRRTCRDSIESCEIRLQLREHRGVRTAVGEITQARAPVAERPHASTAAAGD